MESFISAAPIVERIIHFLPNEYIFYFGLVNKSWLDKCRRRVRKERILDRVPALSHLWFGVGIRTTIGLGIHDFMWKWFISLIDHHTSTEFFGSCIHQFLHFEPLKGRDSRWIVVSEDRIRSRRRELDQFPLIHRTYAKEPWIMWDRQLIYRAFLTNHCAITLAKVQCLLEKIFDMRQLFVGDVVFASIYTNRLNILEWIVSLGTRYAWINPLLDKIARFVVEHWSVVIESQRIVSCCWLPRFVHQYINRYQVCFTQTQHCETLRYICQWVDMPRPIKGVKLHKWIVAECMTDTVILAPLPVLRDDDWTIPNALYGYLTCYMTNSRFAYWMTRCGPHDARLPMYLVSNRHTPYWTYNMGKLFSTFTTDVIEKILLKTLMTTNFGECGPSIISSDLEWFITFTKQVDIPFDMILSRAIGHLAAAPDSRRRLENTRTYLIMRRIVSEQDNNNKAD